MKRFVSLALCLMMVLSLATVAVADGTHTLTINNPTAGHTYEAYQIFTGTLETVAGTDIQVLTNIEWGSAFINDDGDGEKEEGEYDTTAELVADLNAAIAAAADESPLKKLAGFKDAATFAEAMADNITTDSESLDILATIFAKNIQANSNIGTCGYTQNIVTEEDKEVDRSYYTVSGLTPGYYLIKDQDDSLDNKHDSYTKFILRVIKDETVAPKSSVPTVDKKINHNIDGTYVEHEAFDINDTVYYKWTGTLPSNLKDYEVYRYKFYDTLPIGIEFVQFEEIYLEGSDGNLVHSFYDASVEGAVLPDGITQNVDGKNVTLTFENLMTLYSSILPTQKVVVKYSARVTRDALIADPMTNSVTLEFSNDPNADGDGTPTGKTPADVAHAFTFQINVDKYDADDKSKKLEGAEFKLYYERTENDQIVKHFAQVITEEMIYVADKDGKLTTELKPEEDRLINGTPVDEHDVGIIYGWTTTEREASVLDTDAKGEIALRGLDDGIYYLKETKAPAGYNLMETPVKIEIIPAYDENGDEISVSVSYKVDDVPQATNTVGVRNSSGSTLPVTGGIGTTLFYVFGSIMVVGAAVLMVTKKRMGAEG